MVIKGDVAPDSVASVGTVSLQHPSEEGLEQPGASADMYVVMLCATLQSAGMYNITD